MLAIVIDTLIMLTGQADHAVDAGDAGTAAESAAEGGGNGWGGGMNFLQQALSFIFTARTGAVRQGWPPVSSSICSTP